MTKPNKDGWIRHRGGKCPVDAGTMVDVRYRDGSILEYLEALRDYKFKTDHHSGWDAGADYWSHDNLPGDIMAWKLSRPSILDEPGEPNEALKEVLELDTPKISSEPEVLIRGLDSTSLHIQQIGRAYRAEGDPRVMRDRIREIDATTIALSGERASLVAKLKAEGFILASEWGALESSEIQVETRRVEDIAQQDMSDPANWRNGDLVKSVSDYSADILIGGVYALYETPDINEGNLYLIDSNGDKRNRCIDNYAFHSRPTD